MEETRKPFAILLHKEKAMNRVIVFVFFLGGLAFTMGEQAQAQSPYQRPGGVGRNVRPSYSPYLNLLRRDNPTYRNYYGLVRPEQQFRSSLQNIEQEVSGNRSRINSVAEGGGLPETGHRTSFLNLGGYFLSTGGLRSSPGVSLPTASPRTLSRPTPSTRSGPQR
jgi:hypothetical protein